MSGKRITSMAALKEALIDSNIELSETPAVPQLSSFINSDINTSLFVTKFSKEDVGDFCEFMSHYPAIKYRDNLESLLYDELTSWMRLHQQRCPYEPFLWALKLTDNYFGSIANGAAEPDKSMLDPICRALSKIYKSEYDEILINVLLHWEWYQPVHVAIKLYEILDSFENELINDHLRDYWLLHFMYTHNAYRCLLHKEMTETNLKALLFHICNERRPGVNGTDVIITKKDRTLFLGMYHSQKTEVRDHIATLYIDRRQFCPKTVRDILDPELNPRNEVNNDSIIRREMAAYSLATVEEDRVQAQMNFSLSLWQLIGKRNDPDLDYAVREGPRFGLAECVAETLLNSGFDFSTQYNMLKLMDTNSHEYQNIIEHKYMELGASNIQSDEVMMYACAYCTQGHSELVEKIVYAFYVNGYGNRNAQHVFNKIKYVYAQQVDEAIKKVVSECSMDNEKAKKVISNCIQISNSRSTYVPVAFDVLCEQLVAVALKDSNYGYTYARVVLDLISNIATIHNRQRYYNMLMSLYGSKANYLESLKAKVNDLVHKLWPIA